MAAKWQVEGSFTSCRMAFVQVFDHPIGLVDPGILAGFWRWFG
jgi:hypothetical protein